MHTTTHILLAGLILCIVGFVLSFGALGIVIYNYHKSNEELRLARITLESTSQICVFIGFITIYYYIISGLIKSGKF